jgi:DNA polymerase-3 subunit epsilon
VTGSAERLRLRTQSLVGPLACVDLETTGGLAAQHRIIEVGVVLLDGGEVVDEWSTLVNPGLRIPSGIAAFTGIDDAMVAEAPPFEEIASEVRRRLEGRLFIAHNARFDYGFLRAEFRRLGVRFSAPVLCTVRLSRMLYAEHPRHNLDALMDRFELTCAARHRALGDAQVLPALLAAIERQRGEPAMDEAVVEASREPRLPPHLPPDLADDLPDAPGVYLFRDEHDAILYVGRSRNVRSRVFDHFTGSHRSQKHSELTTQVRKVEWIETGGELGALLLERRLLRELAPAGNRLLRGADEDCVVRLVRSGDGLVPQIVRLAEVVLDEHEPSFGPFRTGRDARKALEGKAREAGLCLKVLGLESGEGSCVAYQVQKCRGACVAREPRLLHDARLQLALASLRLKAWPFHGPIGIRERAPHARGTCVHILDRWRQHGTARDEREVADVLRQEVEPGFDTDGYRIIARALKGVRLQDLLTFERPGIGR